jgi:glycosyltransferase involved in cell wall biosynthesis
MSPERRDPRPRVLVLTPYFLPSEQGGGSVRAVHHLCEQLSSECEWVIATGNRDIDRPLDPRACQRLRERTGLDVRYLPYTPWSLVTRLRALLSEPWDLIYFNSLLSPRFTFLPLLLLRSRQPKLVAPRGELLHGAWSRRVWRKRLYLASLRTFGLLRGVHWHATSADELARMAELQLTPAYLAPDLPPSLPPTSPEPVNATQGPLRLVFLSRIDRHKNLDFALRALTQVTSCVTLDVYGPITDDAYWRQCQSLIAKLPTHVNVNYRGALAPHEVMDVLRRYEMFILPTLGENHGYAIGEALIAGCLVLISDRTPWTSASSTAWIQALPLDEPVTFAHAIDTVAQLSSEVRIKLRREAQAWGRSRMNDNAPLRATRQLLGKVWEAGLIQPKSRI